ncbi:photosynthetic complex assembly protein PuhC [Cereibacter changlensis]|uniref:photosynthetic complex assembly protein PuhC n=1 Tax=Cereibacter changlensis TaxID=402884 RepID=UPI004033F75B
MTKTTKQPAMRNEDKEMIPPGLLRMMLALAIASLLVVTYAVVTDREHVGQPVASAIVSERTIIFEGRGAKAVAVRAEDGSMLFESENGGFVTVIQNGLQRARTVAKVDQGLPVRLVEYENGRLTLHDDATGWSAELQAFGDDNKAAFERLLAD